MEESLNGLIERAKLYSIVNSIYVSLVSVSICVSVSLSLCVCVHVCESCIEQIYIVSSVVISFITHLHPHHPKPQTRFFLKFPNLGLGDFLKEFRMFFGGFMFVEKLRDRTRESKAIPNLCGVTHVINMTVSSQECFFF